MGILYAEENKMMFLYPHFLWFLLPLLLLLWKNTKALIYKVHLIVLMLLLVTLSRPVLEGVLQKESLRGKNIIIALDVSCSMQTTDLVPTRYTFAKKTIEELLALNPTDNIMLLAFTSNPLLLSPPTTDHRLIGIALESLNPAFILTKGTSLKRLFKTLDSMQTADKQLLLITDGGEEKELDNLTNALQKTGLSLTVLALGTSSGTALIKPDGSYLKDKEGNLVISRINPLLESLSSAVKGTYLTAKNSPKTTAKALSSVLQGYHAQTQKVQKMQHHYLELYQAPLGLAILLFLLVHTRAVKYLVLLFTFFGVFVHASLLDIYQLNLAYESYEKSDFNTTEKRLNQLQVLSLQSQMALANTYYKQKHFKKAIKLYCSILSTSAPIKQKLYYNIANAYAKQEAYAKAKIYYTKALQLGFDEDASHNLKLVALLSDKKESPLGIAHPKSQDGAASKSDSQKEKNTSQDEDAPSSASGDGGESKSAKEKLQNTLLDDGSSEKHPLSSKVYELINKGYIHENQPW
jgi:Ca-activated chloride channel family protein